MQQKAISYGIIGLLAGIMLTILFTTNIVNSNNTGMMKMMGMRANKNTSQMMRNIDAHFIEQMIPHHEDAITMAKLALTGARKQEVKELAESIIDSQGKEITQMKEWYKEWFGKEVPQDSQAMNQHGMMDQSSMHMGMMGDKTDITRLEEAENFDRAFVEEMIPHHQMAVMMANMLKNSTQRPEMKMLADDIITAQTKEIEQMRSWLNKWE